MSLCTLRGKGMKDSRNCAVTRRFQRTYVQLPGLWKFTFCICLYNFTYTSASSDTISYKCKIATLRIVWNKLLRITFGSPCSWIEQNPSSKSSHFSHNSHGYRWAWWKKGELLMLVLKVWCDRVLCLNSFWTSCKYYLWYLSQEEISK